MRQIVYLIPFVHSGAGRPALLVGRGVNYSTEEKTVKVLNYVPKYAHYESYRVQYMAELLPEEPVQEDVYRLVLAAATHPSEHLSDLAVRETNVADPYFATSGTKLSEYLLNPDGMISEICV